jgi:hypothetical protein
MILSIFCGYALDFLLKIKRKGLKNGVFVFVIFALLYQVYANNLLSNRSGYIANVNGATAFMNSLPPNAILLTSGDEGIALYYVHEHLNVRPDVTIIAYENSYTKQKILDLEEYKIAKKDPLIANELRAKKIISYAMGDRLLVSMVKVAFDSTGLPSRPLLYGYAANRKGFDFSPPKEFFDKHVSYEFIKTLIPATPRPDHWSDSGSLNFLPPLIALLVSKEGDAEKVMNALKLSKEGLARQDLFNLRNRELERRVALKLFSLNRFEDATNILKDVFDGQDFKDINFQDKYLYCTALAKSGEIKDEQVFCQKVLLEQQLIQQRSK